MLSAVLALAAPAALAKGSCCYHPPGAVYFTGSTSVSGVVEPGQPASLDISLIVENGASLTSVTVAAGSAFSLVSTSCATAASCTAVVSFNPTEGGDFSGSITAVATNSYGSGSATATLTGTGYGANYTWSAPIKSSVVAGSRGSVELSLQSTGQTALTINELTLSPSSYLSLGSNTCTAKPIAPGSSCLVTIRYDASLVETDATSYPMDGTISVVSPDTVTKTQGVVDITALVQGNN